MANFKSDNRDRDSRNSRGGFRGRSSGNRFGGGRSGGGGGFRRDSRSPPEMHDVTCDKCGKECQVPFKPSGDKPVLCSECFSKGGGSRSRSSSSGMSSEELGKINTKLDKIIKALKIDSE